VRSETHGGDAHLVWDWNGTLFHDMEAVLAATNACCGEMGAPPLTLERYRELYCLPLTVFYGRIFGRVPDSEEFGRLDASFHLHYAAARERCGLAEGAAELLRDWQAGGGTQSLLSMYGHAELVPLVQRMGISGHFLRIDGRVGRSDVDGKAQAMARHLDALAHSVDPARTVVIGDAADDARAAAHAGAAAVLYTGGSHSRQALSGLGFPVADSLAEAVQLARELVH
jgi:phosphoglycolate phosphatase-like HAD superfamily hydrolase